ncbi:glucooligosaccharide oxidase [Massariosphaeria phaeospora]|uniref:Glucooligosaccharide oxidase n=1 Tax=Massariosphaeria phaeospora TaxID=100035 RepID=A0A7C8MAI3_9PLEO|nr:glucooligosaccharide oxidase [Massariosphaeria phaeospora]
MRCITYLVASSSLLFPFSQASALDRRAALDECLTKLNVPTFISSSANYTQAIKPFNTRVTFKPAAYAVPETTQHVQDAVSCGASNGVRVTAKSGGHSYASHGLGGEDGHLIVDMRNFNNVTVDPTAQTAAIGTGGRLGNVAMALYNQTKQAISHGTCPGVGVGGLTLHGGYGLISRSKGLTLDNILEATVVLANSSVVTASETQHPDLFWALRGAGAAFGIVTSFKFKTFTAPESNIVFQYYLTPANASHLSTILTALQDFSLNTQPQELNMRFFLASFSSLSGVYFGTRADFDKLIAPLLAQMGISTTRGTITTNTWLNTLTSFSNGPLAQAKEYNSHETFFAKSLMPARLSLEAITALTTYWDTNARSNTRAWYLLIDLHGGNSSAVSAVPADATAYSHRDAVFKMQFYDRTYGNVYTESWTAFLNGWVQAIMDASPDAQDMGMYINYADTSLASEEAHRRYWGRHYERAVQVKRGWDPEGMFMGPQIVGR